MSRRWGLFVDPGSRWIPLPVRPREAPEAPLDPLELAMRPAPTGSIGARQFAERVLTELGPVPDAHWLAEQLVGFVDRANRVGAVAAAVLPSEDMGEVLVYLELLLVPAGVLPAGLDRLEPVVRSGGATWQRTSRVDTPAGAAVHLHLMDAEPRGELSLVATESAWWFVPTPDGDAVAVLSLSWTDLTMAEVCLDIAERVAATLVLEREPVS